MLKGIFKNQKISSFHANFISEEISSELDKHDFFRRTGIQYHWENKSFSDFQHFLDSMKSRKKKYSKRKKFS